MKKRYAMVRLPKEAKIGFENKRNVINNILKEERVNKKFTLADTFRFISNKTVFIENREILKFLRNKKKGFNLI